LKKQGKITKITEKDIKPEDVYQNAKEMMIIGGNKIVAVRSFDGKLISEEAGPITKALYFYLKVTLVEKSPHVPLDIYSKTFLSPKL
jgi:hypothetical protein